MKDSRKLLVMLYVVRDDGQHDYRSGFATYEEANAYRLKCNRSWVNHVDYVKLVVRDAVGRITREVNLTKCTDEERNGYLGEYGLK